MRDVRIATMTGVETVIERAAVDAFKVACAVNYPGVSKIEKGDRDRSAPFCLGSLPFISRFCEAWPEQGQRASFGLHR